MPSFPTSSVLGGDTRLYQVGKTFREMAGIQNCFLVPMPQGKMSTVVLRGRSCGLSLFAWKTPSWQRRAWNGKSGTHWDPWELRFTGSKVLCWSPLQIISSTLSKQNGVHINHSNFYRRKLRLGGFESFPQGHTVNDWGVWSWTETYLPPRLTAFLICFPNSFHLVDMCSGMCSLHIISLNPSPTQQCFLYFTKEKTEAEIN